MRSDVYAHVGIITDGARGANQKKKLMLAKTRSS
jgi:hypothetical protein